jgi:hypothetical protein
MYLLFLSAARCHNWTVLLSLIEVTECLYLQRGAEYLDLPSPVLLTAGRLPFLFHCLSIHIPGSFLPCTLSTYNSSFQPQVFQVSFLLLTLLHRGSHRLSPHLRRPIIAVSDNQEWSPPRRPFLPRWTVRRIKNDTSGGVDIKEAPIVASSLLAGARCSCRYRRRKYACTTQSAYTSTLHWRRTALRLRRRSCIVLSHFVQPY